MRFLGRATRIVLLAALACTDLLLAGCGGQSPGPYDRGPAEVLVWQDISKDAGPYLVRAARDFRASNPSVKVRVLWYKREGFLEKVRRAVQSGEGPDLVVVQSGDIDGLVAAKVVTAVDFVYRRRPALLLGAAWNLAKRGDHRYGVPLSLSTVALFHNLDLVPIAPRSSASLLAKTQELFSVGKLGLVTTLRSPLYTFPFFASLWPVDAPQIDVNATATYFQLVQDLANVQGIDFQAASMTEDEARARLLSEDAAMAVLSQRSFWKLRETKLSYGVVPVPRVSGSPSFASPPTAGTIAMVSAYSEDKQLAADVASAMTRSSSLDGYLRSIGELPAATERYKHYPYDGEDGRGFLKAFAVPPGPASASLAELRALSKGLDLVLSKQMSPLQAADVSRSLLGST